MREDRERNAVILDRQPLWLDALDRLVAGVGIEVVGRATNGEEAIALVQERTPDIFIAGINASSVEQVACVRRAQQSNPVMKCVVVAETADLEAVNAAFAAGATVYCLKTAEQEDLISAIHQAFERSVFIAATGYDAVQRSGSSEAESTAHDLTRRELEILRLVAEGHSNSQLAQMLWVTEQTVKFHLSNIYRKLQVANRTEASRWAQLNGLLTSREQVNEFGDTIASGEAA
jgi:DNA-binding NarL/FixJ family response regulator